MKTPTTTPQPAQEENLPRPRRRRNLDRKPHLTYRTLFPGAKLAAIELGCNPSHLYRVLRGIRQGASLRAKYFAWLANRPDLPAAVEFTPKTTTP
jgi:hypothetical protein